MGRRVACERKCIEGREYNNEVGTFSAINIIILMQAFKFWREPSCSGIKLINQRISLTIIKFFWKGLLVKQTFWLLYKGLYS